MFKGWILALFFCSVFCFSLKDFQNDSMIYGYVAGEEKSSLKVSVQQSQNLRYGENPHQKGVFFGDLEKIFTKLNGISTLEDCPCV